MNNRRNSNGFHHINGHSRSMSCYTHHDFNTNLHLSHESDLQVRLGRLSVGSGKSLVLDDDDDDDLLSSNQGGNHDYDWLLTPPGTPLLSSSDGKESQPTSVAPRRNSSVRSASTIKTSRLSVSQSESNHSSRPARSSSATRPSISTTQYTNRNSNILNTSSASVSSYIKPSTFTNRSPSAARRPTSRATTPSRTHQSSTTTSTDRTTQNSRPSTPTRRTPTPSLVPSSPSGGRALPSNGRISRPSSPVSHVRPPSQPPIILHDFPHETPPNLRTTLPERPLSAGRSRPGAAMTVKGHVENTNSGTITKRPSSPIVNRERGRPHTNGNVVNTLETRKTSHLLESLRRKPIKMSNVENGISKKSLDKAVKHMDIRNGGIRPLSGPTLFPQSIRTGNPKMQHGRAPSGPIRNENYLENKYVAPQHNRTSCSSKVAEVDMHESSRYDAMLLKEDLNNTSWLHSTDENNDQDPVFNNGFEPPPEPFGPL